MIACCEELRGDSAHEVAVAVSEVAQSIGKGFCVVMTQVFPPSRRCSEWVARVWIAREEER